MKVSRLGCALVWVAISFLSLTSCSDDDQDEPEEPVYHQSYVQGQVNGEEVFMNDVNEHRLIDKSMYDFISNDQSDTPAKFDWEVKLLETKDSIVTLFLHIDDVELTNTVIYSPDDKGKIKTYNTCYVTVEDLNKKVTKVYHPTQRYPVYAMWRMFTVTEEAKRKAQVPWADNGRMKDIDVKYVGHRWPGIEGNLRGTLTYDDAPNTMTIDIDFRLY